MKHIILTSLIVLSVLMPAPASAQTTQFTHQGTLAVADGDYEFEFRLFDKPTSGTQQGSAFQRLSPNTVHVSANSFTVPIFFDTAAFTGGELYLETS